MPTNADNSGGPLVDAYERVVGVAVKACRGRISGSPATPVSAFCCLEHPLLVSGGLAPVCENSGGPCRRGRPSQRSPCGLLEGVSCRQAGRSSSTVAPLVSPQGGCGGAAFRPGPSTLGKGGRGATRSGQAVSPAVRIVNDAHSEGATGLPSETIRYWSLTRCCATRSSPLADAPDDSRAATGWSRGAIPAATGENTRRVCGIGPDLHMQSTGGAVSSSSTDQW